MRYKLLLLRIQGRASRMTMPNRILKLFTKPLEKFIQIESFSGILLIAFALTAMFLANSSLSVSYFSLLETKIFFLSILHWINDALMAIFFFVVGMEIKREIVIGELSTLKKSALPIASAIGGMVVPALIYTFFNFGKPTIFGWAIPMATDIAFALGILTLFGSRVPLNLKIFLLSLAIVDDLGAVLVIAFFYTEKIKALGLALAALAFFLVVLSKKLKIRNYFVYTILGCVAWAGIFYSGVHATIAGVVLGLLTPYSFPSKDSKGETYSPLENLIHFLHPVVGFLIMPAFALANAGVSFGGVAFSSLLESPISIGVILGLVLGKPIGILVFSRLAVLFRIAELSDRITWKGLSGISILAGVGFTMSIFIANLALGGSEIVYAKLGILFGSLVSASIGACALFLTFPQKPERS